MTQDFTTLNNPKFLYLAGLHQPFPEWVSQSPMPESREFEKKAATAFADPGRRLLPITSKEATFHSAINIFAEMDSYSDEAFERVKSACAFFEIEADVAPYASLFAKEFEKSATVVERPEGRYAIDDQIGDQSFKLLPLNDAEDVRQSANDLTKMASEKRIHVMQLVPAAQEIVKAAADHDISGLPLLVNRLGRERLPDFEKAARMVAGRAELSKDKAMHDSQKLYDEVIEKAAKEEISADECFQGIAAIDDALGLEPNFHKSAAVAISYEIVYGGPLMEEIEKQAKQHVVIRDVAVPLPALAQIPDQEIEYKLSKEAAAQFKSRSDDARDLSMQVGSWAEKDQRTLLRLAAELSD